LEVIWVSTKPWLGSHLDLGHDLTWKSFRGPWFGIWLGFRLRNHLGFDRALIWKLFELLGHGLTGSLLGFDLRVF